MHGVTKCCILAPMKKTKYKKYRNSKYKILKEKKIGESRLQALRFSVEAVMAATQIRIAMQTPLPKYPSGGNSAIVGETGREMVCTGGGKIIGYAPIDRGQTIENLISKLKNETTQKH